MLPQAAKWFDVRAGEGSLITRVAAALFALIAGHTLVETARDALFLSELKPNRLALVYGVLAVLTVGVAPVSSKLCLRYGEKRALMITLVMLGAGTLVFALLPRNGSTVFALYLWAGVATGLAVAQFWMLAARVFTIAQAKRLVGPIAGFGILGGVAGGGLAIVLLKYVTTKELLPVAAFAFAAAALPIRGLTPVDAQQDRRSHTLNEAVDKPSTDSRRYLRLVVLLVATATIALLFLDYMFKATTARSLEPGSLARFFAMYYGGLNLLAFLFQLFVATRVLRNLGVLVGLAVLPALLLVVGSAALMGGASLVFVLVLKGVDGSLRHSLHRTALELLWMPLPPRRRADSKPLVDTFVVRSAQALAAMLVFGLSLWHRDDPRTLTLLVTALTAAWIAIAISLRGPYLALLRRALQDDRDVGAPLRLNLASLAVLVEALASMNASRACAAIQLLASHDKARLIPALVLFHPSPEVLQSALQHVPASDRQDWVEPVRRLTEHESQAVRVAAMSALLRYGIRIPIEERLSSSDPALRGHAAFVLADRSAERPEEHPSVTAILALPGRTGKYPKAALLQAIGTQRDPKWTPVITRLLHDPTLEISMQAIRVAAEQPDPALIPSLVELLVFRKQRDSARDALVHHGSKALTHVAGLLRDTHTAPRLRRHLPRTLSRFATQAAADILLGVLEKERVGLVRYKALRGLCRLTTESTVTLDRQLLERLLCDNVVEHVRTRAYHDVIQAFVAEAETTLDVSARLLLDLLADKAAQALERALRMLQLLNPTENIRSASDAILSGDKTAHAQAVEFLATLSLDLEQSTRELLRIATDNLDPAERAALSREHVPNLPADYGDAMVELFNDDDDSLSAIAAYHLKCAAPGLPDAILQKVTRSAPLDAAAETARLEGVSIAE